MIGYKEFTNPKVFNYMLSNGYYLQNYARNDNTVLVKNTANSDIPKEIVPKSVGDFLEHNELIYVVSWIPRSTRFKGQNSKLDGCLYYIVDTNTQSPNIPYPLTETELANSAQWQYFIQTVLPEHWHADNLKRIALAKECKFGKLLL